MNTHPSYFQLQTVYHHTVTQQEYTTVQYCRRFSLHPSVDTSAWGPSESSQQSSQAFRKAKQSENIYVEIIAFVEMPWHVTSNSVSYDKCWFLWSHTLMTKQRAAAQPRVWQPHRSTFIADSHIKNSDVLAVSTRSIRNNIGPAAPF